MIQHIHARSDTLRELREICSLYSGAGLLASLQQGVKIDFRLFVIHRGEDVEDFAVICVKECRIFDDRTHVGKYAGSRINAPKTALSSSGDSGSSSTGRHAVIGRYTFASFHGLSFLRLCC